MTSKKDNINKDIVKELMEMAINNRMEDATQIHEKGIIISPTVAILTLLGILTVFFQIFMGFMMWAIQDRLTKYDSFEPRIASIEQSLIKFGDLPSDVKALSDEFKRFNETPRFTEDKFEDKIKPVMDGLVRIENSLVERTRTIDSEFSTVEKNVSENDKRIRLLETELELYKRTTSTQK